jgi:hypothetical protein
MRVKEHDWIAFKTEEQSQCYIKIDEIHSILYRERDELRRKLDLLLAAAKVSLHCVTGGFVGLKPRKEYEAEVGKRLREAIAEAEKVSKP